MELGLPVWSPQIGTREMGLCTSGRGLRTLYYTVAARLGGEGLYRYYFTVQSFTTGINYTPGSNFNDFMNFVRKI